MLIRRKLHERPELNTTSTADISFMLLIFFLVTTSMDVDKGLRRQLPPPQTEKVQQQSLVDKSKLLELKITAQNQLLVNGKPFHIDLLRNEVETFVQRVGKAHLISLSSDPQSEYDTYFKVQQQLVLAYKNVRNKLSQQQFNRSFAACTSAQRDAILDLCPQRVTEIYQTEAKGMKP